MNECHINISLYRRLCAHIGMCGAPSNHAYTRQDIPSNIPDCPISLSMYACTMFAYRLNTCSQQPCNSTHNITSQPSNAPVCPILFYAKHVHILPATTHTPDMTSQATYRTVPFRKTCMHARCLHIDWAHAPSNQSYTRYDIPSNIPDCPISRSQHLAKSQSLCARPQTQGVCWLCLSANLSVR